MLFKLLKFFLAHPRVGSQVVDRLADSWPIRRAAKFTAYLYLRGKHQLEQQLKTHGKSKPGQSGDRDRH